MPNEFLQGLSVGSGIGQGWANQRLQQQKFKADEAERMIRERKLTNDADLAALKLQELSAELKKKAADDVDYGLAMEFTKGKPKEVRFEALKTLALDGNERAARTIKGVVEAESLGFKPSGMIDPTTGVPVIEESPGNWQAMPSAVKDEEISPEIRQLTDPNGNKVSMTRTGKNTWREVRGDAGYAPSDAGKKISELEKRGRKVTKEETDILYGLEARPGVTHPLTKEKYIESHIERKIAEEGLRKKTRKQHIEELAKEFDELFMPKVSPTIPTGPGPVEQFMRGAPTPASPTASRLSDEFKNSSFFKPKKQ